MDILSENSVIYHAAIFACTNMGHRLPAPYALCAMQATLQSAHPQSTSENLLRELVETTCGHYCESEDHFDMFYEEGLGFLKQLRGQPADYVEKSWPDYKLLWKYPDAPQVGKTVEYVNPENEEQHRKWRITGYEDDHPTIAKIQEILRPSEERKPRETFFIWTFRNAGHCKATTPEQTIEYNTHFKWEGKL